MTDDELKGLFAGFSQEMRQEMGALRQEIAAVREENLAMHTETRQSLSAAIAAVREENVAMHVETRRHFDVVAEDLGHRVALVAEVLTATREQLTREAADIRDEMRRTAEDTQALIKFSHTDLDRRVRVLEEK